MAAIIICSDFGAPQNKVWHCFHCFPIYFPKQAISLYGVTIHEQAQPSHCLQFILLLIVFIEYRFMEWAHCFPTLHHYPTGFKESVGIRSEYQIYFLVRFWVFFFPLLWLFLCHKSYVKDTRKFIHSPIKTKQEMIIAW